jgi:hypothetical protein
MLNKDGLYKRYVNLIGSQIMTLRKSRWILLMKNNLETFKDIKRFKQDQGHIRMFSKRKDIYIH